MKIQKLLLSLILGALVLKMGSIPRSLYQYFLNSNLIADGWLENLLLYDAFIDKTCKIFVIASIIVFSLLSNRQNLFRIHDIKKEILIVITLLFIGILSPLFQGELLAGQTLFSSLLDFIYFISVFAVFSNSPCQSSIRIVKKYGKFFFRYSLFLLLIGTFLFFTLPGAYYNIELPLPWTLYAIGFSPLNIMMSLGMALLSGNITSFVGVAAMSFTFFLVSLRITLIRKSILGLVFSCILFLSLSLSIIPFDLSKQVGYADRFVESSSALVNFGLKQPLSFLYGIGSLGLGNWVVDVSSSAAQDPVLQGIQVGDQMPRYLHNSYLSVLLSYGAIGAILFCVSILFVANKVKIIDKAIFSRIFSHNFLQPSHISARRQLVEIGIALVGFMASSLLMYQLSHVLLPVFLGLFYSLFNDFKQSLDGYIEVEQH